jgi:hypothetical protein
VYLDSDGKQAKYKSFNFRTLPFTSQTWRPPGDFDVCRQLKGMVVDISYKAIEDSRFAGEMTSVDIKKVP